MKEYYQQRFYWIFHYTSKNVGYIIAKTLCLVVGLPIYAVMFLVEMLLTGIYMLFSWIPILNVVVMVICKALIAVAGATFYINILTDLNKFREATADCTYNIYDAETDQDAADAPADEPAADAEQAPATPADEPDSAPEQAADEPLADASVASDSTQSDDQNNG